MWIRSRDRSRLINTKDIYLLDNGIQIMCVVGGNKTLIGSYKTNERALEVLDEIQETIIRTDSVITVSGDALEQNTVYNMPKE